MGVLAPPKAVLSWTATSLGSAFQAYRIWRRPARLPVSQWELIAEISVPAGYVASDVEAQHTTFTDYEAGWLNPSTAIGQWADGWDYAVSVLDGTKNVESPVSAVYRVTVRADDHPWLTFNNAPYLNTPVERMDRAEGADDDPLRIYDVAGRDEVVTRTAIELPARRYDLGWVATSFVGEDQLRLWRAAASSGLTGALLLPLGDRVIGSPSVMTKVGHTEELVVEATMKMIETDRKSAVAWYNGPCGLYTNGSTGYVEHGDDNTLDPAADFTAFCFATVVQPSGVAGLLTKSSTSASTGWALYANGATVNYQTTDATRTVQLTSGSSVLFGSTSTPFLVAGCHGATGQQLYLNADLVASSSSAVAAISNSFPVRASSFPPGVAGTAQGVFYAWGCYNRRLTATEVGNLYHYLAGHAGYRPPAGAALFVDCRDDRCWPGAGAVLQDLSGFGMYGTSSGTVATRGQPWALRLLEKF